MTFIKEFIDALAIEIDALKKGKGGSIVTLYNGKFLRQTLEFYIYQFSLENFLIALDDTPANIEVNGKEYECDIISISGQQVQISVKQKLSETISIAKLKTNTWYLLERLKKKYEDNLNSQSRFNNSDKLFQDHNSKIDGGNFSTSYISNQKGDPNASQHEAIATSINDFITIIWGPPGTGKTKTIAYTIESHLNLGRKVLLLSHSNNAVDQALTKVAGQMISTYYKEGQLVRLGTPKAEMLETIEAKCPLVLIEKIAEFKSKELITEKTNLSKELEKINQNRHYLEYAIILRDIITENETTLRNGFAEINDNNSKIKALKEDLGQMQKEISELNEKLQKAQNSGSLKRIVLGLDPKKIETNIKKLTNNVLLRSDQLKNLESYVKELNLKIQPLIEEKSKAEQELSKHLNKLNKSLEEIEKNIVRIDERIKNIQVRLDEINKAIEEIKKRIINDSKLIATTLTKSYISKDIEDTIFDILIVDEVSMAPMPMLYWAASKITKGITIVGDFKQLPPICISDDGLAKKWLGRSIFDELDIKDIVKAEQRVQLLNYQYRMHPDISEIVNNKMYGNKLINHESVNNKIKNDTISSAYPLCLIDTSPHNPWCSQFESGGRFNLISALICVSVVKKILSSYAQNESIGIITPYRNQARLIRKIADDNGFKDNPQVKIDTVHSFQGGQETAIIFDSVEGEGAKKWSMINEFNNTESANLLLNVALTRAETKLYVVANSKFIQSTFESNSFFMDILRTIISKGIEIKSTEIISDLRDENFEYWISMINSLKNRPENFGVSYNEQDFWPAFHNDLSHAKEELIIFSPFLTSERFGKLHLIFSELINMGIKIHIITLPPNEHPSIMQGSREVLTKLKNLGINVKFRHAMHEKIALIDRKVKWIGSLNILSHNTKKEYMERISGESSGKELFEKFNLEELLINQNINGELCPSCLINDKINFIVPKFSRQNRQFFYGCSSYPDCEFTANINTRIFDNNSNQSKKRQQKEKKDTKQTPPKSETNRDTNSKDLFGEDVKGQQWETPLCYWSSVKLPGFKYSPKKNAWWKSKKN